jgi:hypothetical protein
MNDAAFEFEPAIARALEEYATPPTGDGNWHLLLRKARPRRKMRRLAFALAAAAVVLVAATPLGGAIRSAISDFSAWVAGTPGTPVSEEEQRAFDKENARSWVGFPGSPKLRRLIHTEVDGIAYDLVGFRSGESLCIRLTATGAADGTRLTCAPVEELRQDDVPVRVLLADWGIGRGDKEETIGFDTYHSTRAQVTAGIAADGVDAVELVDDHGTHRVGTHSNAFLYVAERPEVGQRVTELRARLEDGGTVEVPYTMVAWGPAPGFGGAPGEPGGPTKVEREVHGGTVTWIRRREQRGGPIDEPLRDRLPMLKRVEFARLLTPDPGSAKRIAVTIGEFEHPAPTTRPGPVVCATVISRDGSGGGCTPLADMFPIAPFTFGYSVSGAGDQYATFAGLASDDVARLQIYTAKGNTIRVALRDNAFLAEVALARLPAKMVAYDAQGRVIGIETTPRDEGPQRILPERVLELRASAEGVVTLELRANKTREGGECWAVRGTGSVQVNAGACITKTWSYAPLRLGTIPDPAIFVYGRVRSDVRRLGLRYADGVSGEVVPGQRGYVLSVVPERQRRHGGELVEIIGRGEDGRAIARLRIRTP